jgi:hypothetical protein
VAVLKNTQPGVLKSLMFLAFSLNLTFTYLAAADAAHPLIRYAKRLDAAYKPCV